jgi:hypothetical protein
MTIIEHSNKEIIGRDDINDVDLVFETESWQVAMNKINKLFNEVKK